ncbi:hypothetical protein DRP04_07580 [Archaeoglobales archaeon]|nr:MAG: hypothetical protein DRP04_07580 [Archaeoglobales archaeon]
MLIHKRFLFQIYNTYRQVEKDIKVKGKIFNVKPKVFWFPELAYDPLLLGTF